MRSRLWLGANYLLQMTAHANTGSSDYDAVARVRPHLSTTLSERMRKLRLSINAGPVAVQAFKILKAFDPAIELGPALGHLRRGTPIIDVDAQGAGAIGLLEQLLTLIDRLDELVIPYVLEITDGAPQEVKGGRPVWPTRIGHRNDIVAAIKEEQLAKLRTAEEAERHRTWARSPEGQKYLAILARLDFVRDFLRDRWDHLGFEDLRSYERDYIYIWWLYVETTSGGFDQYFYNSAGDLALLTLAALETVGAAQAHRILGEALAEFDVVGGFQQDRNLRQECMSRLPDGAFGVTTKRFYDITEDIRSLALLRVEREYLKDGVYPE